METLINKKNSVMEEHKKKKAKALERSNVEIMHPLETKEQLFAKLKKCTERQNERATRESIVDFKEVEEEYQKLTRECVELQGKVENQETLLRQIEEITTERRDMVIDLRKRICSWITRRFNYMTSTMANEIGCEIALQINILKKELRFKFKKEGGEILNTNIASLSGGEKSFAQMALICSLWNHIQPPFRCLDEWDVFLDPVNRNKIQKQLYTFGLKHQEKQFIFLSPQGSVDLNAISPEDRDMVSAFDIKK